MFRAEGMKMFEMLQTNLGEDIYYGHAQPSFLDRAEEVEVIRLDLQQHFFSRLCRSRMGTSF